MAVDKALSNEIMERLAPLGDVTGRSMFSGFAFWEQGAMFALIDGDGQVRFKADEHTEGAYRDAGSAPFTAEMASGRTMTMPYWTVPADVLADDDRFDAWARTAIEVGHATKKAKPAKRAGADRSAARKQAPEL